MSVDRIASHLRGDPGSMLFAYLVSQYPAVNHTHILREICELRELGWNIKVASISSPDRAPAHLTAAEAAESAQTFYVKRRGVAGALAAHALTLVAHPVDYLRGLAYALQLDFGNIPGTLRNLLYVTEALIIARWLRSQEITHIHVHFSSTVGLFLTRVYKNCGVSMSIHGSAEFYDPVAFHLPAKIGAAAFIRAISDYGRSQLMRLSDHSQWGKIEVCRLGVDPEIFTPRPFHSRPAIFEILYVGQLAPPKGQHILLEAIAELLAAGRNCRLRLVGGGPDRAGLEEHARSLRIYDSVVFDGILNEDNVRARFQEADIFVLPSFAEGIPVVLMEAMSMEIPCVATCITGIPELIRDGIDGLLVPPSDAGAMGDAIARLMDDSSLRESLGRAGRATVIERYNLKKNVVQLAKVFERKLRD